MRFFVGLPSGQGCFTVGVVGTDRLEQIDVVLRYVIVVLYGGSGGLGWGGIVSGFEGSGF